MKFSRINETTIRCYLTREDLESSGINLDDIMERKTNAMEYLRRVIMEAAREENFQLDGAVNTMQIRAMMDIDDFERRAGSAFCRDLRCAGLGPVAGSRSDRGKAGSGCCKAAGNAFFRCR